MNTTRIAELESQIRTASAAYYNAGDGVTGPEITDAAFDALVDELRLLDPDNQLLSSVGTPEVNGNYTEIHPMPMYSLNKVTTRAEIAKFVGEVQDDAYVLEAKYDGISMETTYVNGQLVMASTRGDGRAGVNILAGAMRMPNLPKQIPVSNGTVVVRGEAICLDADWAKIDPQMKSNPRSAGNGAMQRSDGEGCQHMTFIAYWVRMPDSAAPTVIGPHTCTTEPEQLDTLKALGFTTATAEVVSAAGKTASAVAELIETALIVWKDKRTSLGFPIDGVVIKAVSLKRQAEMGAAGNRPKGAAAFKWESDEATSRVRKIHVTVGHTGALIPVAEIDPVRLYGTTVSRILLNNFRFIDELGLNIGDEVAVTKRGEIIPYIERVTEKALRCECCGFIGLLAEQEVHHGAVAA